jgi:serine/threonine-protein kinase HipA
VATVAEVRLWGRTIGAVALEEGSRIAAFQYDPAFLASSIELSPITMPLSRRVYQFPSLPEVSFRGLPGLLADSLPDRFGHALIDAWLATEGRRPESFNAIERLCYIGVRGMGALEFAPTQGPPLRRSVKVQVDELVKLASQVLTRRASLQVSFAQVGGTMDCNRYCGWAPPPAVRGRRPSSPGTGRRMRCDRGR